MRPELALFYLDRPPAAPAARPPLLLLLHGVGSSEADMAGLFPAFDPRFHVLSVRSPHRRPTGGSMWFEVAFTPQGPVIDAQQAEAGRQALLAFIGEAAAAYGADPARVYLMGFSQGAIMSASALLTAPERVAGAVLHSGRILPEIRPLIAAPARLAGKPLLVLHGVHDNVLPIHHARASRQLLSGLPVELSYQELELGHTIDQGSLAIAAQWLSGQLDRAPAQP